MPNGIDLTRFGRDLEVRGTLRQQLGIEDRFVWIAVGRIDPSKDYANLVRAWARVVTHSCNSLLLIVGDGPLRARIEESVREDRLEGSVRFLGRRDDVPDLMRAADGYVMSSAWEGLPMVLLEAAASGLPIVATDVGGNAEIVRHGETGELVTAGDDAALADAMIRTMDLPDDVRFQRGDAGAVHVQEAFDLEGVVDRWEELYRELLVAAGEGPASK